MEREHQGRTALTGDGRLSITQSDEQLAAGMAVMADVLERDGAELSALEYRRQQLSGADHLGALNVMWQDQTWQATSARFAAMVAAALPEGYPAESAQARWLYRTLRSAELRHGPRGRCCAARSSAAAWPPAATSRAWSTRGSGGISGRRSHWGAPSWSQQMPEIADRAGRSSCGSWRRRWTAGESGSASSPASAALPWATEALGPVPEDPAERLEWQQRAASVGAYRETYGYDNPAEAIGPEPAAGESPDKRAAWHDALRALGPVAGTDLRGKTDGQLWLMRDTYEAESAWLPKYVAPALGLVRQSAGDAAIEALRGGAEAKVAEARGDEAAAERHRARAAASRAKFSVYHAQEKVLERADAEYRGGVAAIEPQLRLAAAADTLLRTRHPEFDIPPLSSGVLEPVSDTERGEAAKGDRCRSGSSRSRRPAHSSARRWRRAVACWSRPRTRIRAARRGLPRARQARIPRGAPAPCRQHAACPSLAEREAEAGV